MKCKNILKVATATAVLAALGAGVYAQDRFDKYSLKSPSGIAFSDFRGYEDWAVVSSARTDEVLKVIVANPTMINAYKAGVPSNGQPFPEGSKIAKLQWSFKKSTEAPFVVDVPNAPTQAFFIEKDSNRFPNTTGGWGYAQFRAVQRYLLEVHRKDGFEAAERGGVTVLGDCVGLIEPQDIVSEAAHSREDAGVFSDARCVFA